MPLIRVQTSASVSAEKRREVMSALSKAVAKALGKPESYLMVVFESDLALLMAGGAEPAALAEVRSVGTISPDQALRLAAVVSEAIGRLGVDRDRIYTNCFGVPGAMWGQGDGTFG